MVTGINTHLAGAAGAGSSHGFARACPHRSGEEEMLQAEVRDTALGRKQQRLKCPSSPQKPPKTTFGKGKQCLPNREELFTPFQPGLVPSLFIPAIFLLRPAFNTSVLLCLCCVCCQPPQPLPLGQTGAAVLPNSSATTAQAHRFIHNRRAKAGQGRRQHSPGSPPPGPQWEADTRLHVPVTLLTRVLRLGCIQAGSQLPQGPG